MKNYTDFLETKKIGKARKVTWAQSPTNEEESKIRPDGSRDLGNTQSALSEISNQSSVTTQRPSIMNVNAPAFNPSSFRPQ